MTDTFFAHQADGKRRFWIYREPPGWRFVYDQLGADGEWKPGWDIWEERFSQIAQYPPIYSEGVVTWRRESTGELVDLGKLQPQYERE